MKKVFGAHAASPLALGTPTAITQLAEAWTQQRRSR